MCNNKQTILKQPVNRRWRRIQMQSFQQLSNFSNFLLKRQTFVWINKMALQNFKFVIMYIFIYTSLKALFRDVLHWTRYGALSLFQTVWDLICFTSLTLWFSLGLSGTQLTVTQGCCSSTALITWRWLYKSAYMFLGVMSRRWGFCVWDQLTRLS